MLYPLSYEGLRCTFALYRASLRPLGSGLLPRSRRSVPHLCRVPCDQLLTNASTRGADCTADSAVSRVRGRGATR